MSPAAVRISSAMPLAAPVSANPRITSGVDRAPVASAVIPQPAAAIRNPPPITGRRPTASIARPAGTAASADAVRKIAGPSPSSPSTPVTSTNVSDDTAATSCSTAEYTAIVVASSSVLRPTLSAGSVVADIDLLAHLNRTVQFDG